VTLDSIDLTLWLFAVLLEGAVLGVVLWRRVYRTLPIFSCFLGWCLLSDAGMAAAQRLPNAYLFATLVNITVDALFQVAILAELGKAAIRKNRVERPSRVVIFLLAILAALLSMLLNRWKIPTEWPLLNLVYMVLLQFLATLRLVFLLTLVWWSSLLKLRWNQRDLRILTGLGLYILVTFLVVVLHAHDLNGVKYHWLDQLLVASYLWALCLWMLASTTKVAEQTY
jgi:hypothetical protein